MIKLFAVTLLVLIISCSNRDVETVTVPMRLDNNRMLVNAEIQKPDGYWEDITLWVDTGNPDFFISEKLAGELGISISDTSGKIVRGAMEVSLPVNVRIGGRLFDFKNAASKVIFEPKWLFSTMNIDANLPSTVLKDFQVVFDYPEGEMILGSPGSLKHEGSKSDAIIDTATGIVQLSADIYGDSLSFALDNGASYSFTSPKIVNQILDRQSCPQIKGAAGCANIWGWWPGESDWDIIRVPEIRWGSELFTDAGLVGLPEYFPLAEWYSQKTANPVDGIFGPNVFKSYRVEIDYRGRAVYFEKFNTRESYDLDIIGITLQPQSDGNYLIIGIVNKAGQPAIDNIYSGDMLIKIDDMPVKNKTMGTIIDALRGKPGDLHKLEIKRNDENIIIEARVKRLI